jgi:3-phosphoglycerate kinase
MPLRHIKDIDVTGRKILLRVDFNVEVNKKTGKLHETFKIAAAKETIDYLLSKERTKVALITHYGRPEGRPDMRYSVAPLLPEIEKILGRKLHFVPDCIGDAVKAGLESLPDKELLLLENVRFYAEEEAKDFKFSQALAEPFNLFVNDAFSVCHRNQASITGITLCIPSYGGFQMEKEITNLDRIRQNPDHPAVAIIGGAKVETKLPLIQALEKNYDWVLIGGKVANEAIDLKIPFSAKVLVPIDFESSERLDIGKETIRLFLQKIAEAKMIIWNGPMGKFEDIPYDEGTKAILHAVLESGAFTVVGGGESLGVIESLQCADKISFISTGGGAMLEYLSGKLLPGVEVLHH